MVMSFQKVIPSSLNFSGQSIFMSRQSGAASMSFPMWTPAVFDKFIFSPEAPANNSSILRHSLKLASDLSKIIVRSSAYDWTLVVLLLIFMPLIFFEERSSYFCCWELTNFWTLFC